jgi:uncharacterized protein YcbK (DUF882 family)
MKLTAITPHFHLEEFARPERMRKSKRFPAAPYPAEWIEDRLHPLCNVLEAIRAALGDKVIRVGSGYRDRAYNFQIGGARASQHMEGRAADIIVQGVSPADVHKCIYELHIAKQIKVGGLGSYPTFTHVDIRPGKFIRTWTGSRTTEG